VLERDSKSKLHLADISQWYHFITVSRLASGEKFTLQENSNEKVLAGMPFNNVLALKFVRLLIYQCDSTISA
jgi:hypothetical protein